MKLSMTAKQHTLIERWLLSSAVSPQKRREVRAFLEDELDTEQASGIIKHLEHHVRLAPPREERPARDRVYSYAEKIRYYSKRGAKPTLKPLVADFEWLAEARSAQAERSAS